MHTFTSHTKRKPNDCVVCGAIVHLLGVRQCHRRKKAELPMSGVCPHIPHKFGFLFMLWFLSFITIKYPKVKFYVVLKKHAT